MAGYQGGLVVLDHIPCNCDVLSQNQAGNKLVESLYC